MRSRCLSASAGGRLLSRAPTGAARGQPRDPAVTRLGSPTCRFQLCYRRRVLRGCLSELPAAEQLVALTLEVTRILGSSGLPGVRVVGAAGRLCLPGASRLLGSLCRAPTRSPAALAPAYQLLLDVAHGARGPYRESAREVSASPDRDPAWRVRAAPPRAGGVPAPCRPEWASCPPGPRIPEDQVGAQLH